MANTKNQIIIINLELVDEIIVQLKNLQHHYQIELVSAEELYPEHFILSMAENYGRTIKLISDLENHKKNRE